jgi:hypothetical protein
MAQHDEQDRERPQPLDVVTMLENGDNQLARLPSVALAVSEKTDRAA